MFAFIPKIFTSINLFKIAFRKYKKTIIILTGLGFASGMLGGIGISAIVPLFSFIGTQSGVPNDPITKVFKMVFFFLGVEFSLPLVLVALVALFVFKALFLYIANLMSAKATLDYEVGTRNELFKYTMRANWPYLINRKIGHLSQIITESVSGSAALLTSLSMAILFSTSFITYAIIAIGISPYITMMTVFIGAITFYFMKPLFYKIRKLSNEVRTINKEVSHHINQHILGSKTVKSMAVEGEVVGRGERYLEEFSRARLKLAKYNNILGTFLEPLTLAIIIPVFLMTYKSPTFNIASFAAILYLVQKMFSFIQSMQIRISAINEGIPHLVAVVSYRTEAARYKEQLAIRKDLTFNSVLKFEDVGFHYADTEKKVLDGLSCMIKKGEMVGLVGHSGSGKTTVVDLLMRLFNPTDGTITVDGVNISEINLQTWRKHIGYVSQDIFLLNDTVANNIRFYDDAISENEIAEAAKLANIYDFVMRLPEKFDTSVGERGLKLSVGQRQRIVLARIIARNPKLLILDEATSALDNESEVAIQLALAGLHGKITILIVAHRLSTVTSANKIMVLDSGKIIEEGLPAQLLDNKDSRFYKMYHIRE